MKQFDVLIENKSNEKQNIELFSSVDLSAQPTKQYRFTLPYATSYSAGTYFRAKIGSNNYSFTITETITLSELISLLNINTFAIWKIVSSNAIEGNIIDCYSVDGATELEINSGSTAGWSDISYGSNLYKSVFVSGLNILLIDDLGTFYKSTDGGSSFSTQALFDSAGIKLYFLSSTIGFAIGSDTIKTPIQKTTNGGNSWSDVIGGTLLFTTGYFAGIFFLNSLEGWVASNALTISKSIDGGNNWTDFMATKPVTLPSGVYNILDLHFFDSNNGIVVGWESGDGRAFIWSTSDGGSTYTDITTVFSSFPYLGYECIEFVNSLIGFVGGADDVNGGVILKTTNGGITWIPKLTVSGERITDIIMIDTNTGYATCTNGNVYKTTDGGETWVAETIPISDVLNAVFFESSTNGAVCGENGAIAKYSE